MSALSIDAVVEDNSRLADRLVEFIARQMPSWNEITVHGLRRTSSGFARENWVFELSWHDGTGDHQAPLILRRDPTGSLLVTSRENEFELLRALERYTSLPTPTVRWLETNGDFFGRPAIVMDRVTEGTCDWFVLQDERRPLGSRVRLGRQFIDLLAEVQRVDWRRDLGDILSAPTQPAALAELEHWAGLLEDQRLVAYPELEVVRAWLADNVPDENGPYVLVHGDYKPGNMLIEGERVTALLDWETAHVGDALEDLGWVTNPGRVLEHQIDSAWVRSDIVGYFTSVTGRPVAESALRYWNIFANFKLATITVTGIHAFIKDGNFSMYWGPEKWIGIALDLIESSDATVA